MKPVNQTQYKAEKGDCLRACLASLLERPIDDFELPPDEGFTADFYADALAEKGFHLPWLDFADGVYPPGYSIACYQDGDEAHAVVCLDGECVHDPNETHWLHWDRDQVTCWGLLVPLDPV